MAMSYELLLKERDELQREAATANAELFAVLKQSEYRSAEELGLVRAQAQHQEHSSPCSVLPTLAQPAIHHVCRAPFTSRCARCQTDAFRAPACVHELGRLSTKRPASVLLLYGCIGRRCCAPSRQRDRNLHSPPYRPLQ
jgi:hypothetical protein